jgi:hypothetical protein
MCFSKKSMPTIAVLLGALGTSARGGSIHPDHTKAERQAAADLKFYERVERLRDRDPARFDRIHPLTGRMLSDERVYEKLLAEWKAHPYCFERAHSCLWHVLDGMMHYRNRHPFHPPVSSIGQIVGHPENGPPPGGETPDTGGGGDSGGGTLHGSVPEPSTAVTSLTAFVLALLGAARRWAYLWLRPHRPSGASAAGR